jgi:hypothetical protein
VNRKVPLGLWIILITLVLLAGIGYSAPGNALYDLTIGWIHYLGRVIPQVHVSWPGIVTAAVCLAGLAVGLHLFFRWFFSRAASGNRQTNAAPPWPFRWTVMILILVVLLFIAGISVVGLTHQTAWLLTSPQPLVGGGREEAAARTQQTNNLKLLALAMHNYQSVEGTLPPPAVYSKDGRPLLSWRVLLLPYIEEQHLYKAFRLDEPWDSPHNLRLLGRLPRVYDSARRKEVDRPHTTHYLAFVGKGTAFEGRQRLRMPQDFPDGTANTILIVDAAQGVLWTEPEDLSYDPAQPLPALGALSPQYFHALLVDGSVRQINRKTSDQTLRAAITRNGGETLGPDW